MDYTGRLAEKLKPKQSNSAPYNSPEAPIRIRELSQSRYAPFTAVYEAVKPRSYTNRVEYKTRESAESKNSENGDYETLEDIVRAA